jgi:large subunit ribosomal protein L10
MLAPITGLAVVLKQIAEKGGEAAPAEAAPAAE